MFTSDRQFYPIPQEGTVQIETVGKPNGIGNILFSKDLTHGINWFLGVLPIMRQYKRIQKQIKNEFDIFVFFPCRYFQSPPLMRYVTAPIVYLPMEPPRYVYESFARYGRQEQHKTAKGMMKEIKKKVLGKIDQKNVSYATELIAISRYTQKYLQHIYNQDVSLCHFGVDPSEFFPMPGIVKERLVLSVGSLQPVKGHDFVLRSLAKMKIDKKPKMVIICNSIDVTEKKFLEELSSKLRIELCILFMVSHEELRLWYNRAWVIACGQVGEPFGLVVLEALACGTPVVAVNEGGFPDIVSSMMGGLLAERDEQKFADVLSFFFESESITKEWGMRGREIVSKEWTWEKSCKNLEIILDRITRK
jgi:glycosyltransferase involved in cell wall biosynthesis